MYKIIVIPNNKEMLNIDFDDKDFILGDLINDSVIIIEASTGANLEIIKEINNEKLSRLYKTVQKLLIKEEFEEKSSDSKALTAKYLKLKAFYRKTVKEYGN